MSLHPHDRQAVLELRAHDARRCPNGHHPDDVGRLVPGWEQCGLCVAVEQERRDPSGPLDDKGDPLPGWYMVLRPVADDPDE